MMNHDHDNGKHRSSRLRKRTVRSLLVIFFVAAVTLLGWYYLTQNWNADVVMRRNVLPQLEAQLGESIQVGSVETNYLSWVRLHNVTVGKNANLPGGALFQANTVNITLNIPALVLGKKDVLDSISSATIFQPTLFVKRDKGGKFNLSKLFESELSSETSWMGTIRVRDGSIIYQDEALRNTRDKSLYATVKSIDADVRFDGKNPIIYDVGAAKVLLNNRVTSPQLKIAGSASSQGEWVQGKLSAVSLPAALVTDYLFHNKLISAKNGHLDGNVDYYWKKDQAIQLTGMTQLSGITGALDVASISPKLKPINISNASGVVRFDKQTITLRGMQLRAHSGPLSLEGTIVYGIKKPAFDINATSSSFNFADWGKWLKPALPQMESFRGVPGVVSLRLSGNADQLTTTGTLTSRQVVLQQKKSGTFRATALSAGWKGQIQTGKNLRVNVLFDLNGKGATIDSAQGKLKATTLQGKLQVLNSPQLLLKGQFKGNRASATISSGETVQSAQANITLLFNKSTFIQFAGNNNVLQSPQLGRVSSNNIWAQAEINNSELTVQSQLHNFSLRSAKYGNANGKTIQFTAAKQLPLDTKTSWRGKVLVKDADLQQIKLAAISPQLKDHLQNVGRVDGSLQFLWNAQNPQISGQFQLSHLTVLQDQQKVPLREIKSTFSYAQNRLLLNQLSAKSPYGDLHGQLSANLKANNFDFLIQAPQAQFNAQELNPYLASQQINLQGTAKGKLWLSATSKDKTQISAKFDLQLPASKVLLNKSTNILAKNGHLQGQVKGSFNNRSNWHFETQTALAAKSGLLLQNSNSARLANFRLVAQGNISNSAGNVRPTLEGTLETEALKLDMASLRAPAALAKVRTKWQWMRNELHVPRISALYANGDMDGHLKITDFDRTSPHVTGEFLARELNMGNLSSWLHTAQPQLLPRADLNGTGFIKASFDGALDQMKMDLDVQVYKGNFLWNDGTVNKLPLDKVDFKTQLLLTGGKSTFTIPLQELTLWSDGARLAAQGELRYLSDKSTFAYDADLALDGLQLANAIQNLPLPESVTQWQKKSDTDGVLNARLNVSGEGDNPRATGTLRLRVVNSYDTTLRDAHADVQAQLLNGSPVVHLQNITGNLAQAPFTADLKLDGVNQLWTANADVTGLPAFELLGLSESAVQSDNLDHDGIHLSRLPLRGDITAKFSANGSIDLNSKAPSFNVSDGVLKVTSPKLSWHGEELGVLDADFKLTPDFLQIQQATLRSDIAKNPRLISLYGRMPWDTNAPGLSASLQAQNARISFLSMLLDQTQQVGMQSGNGDLWLQLQNWRNDLPPSTEGNVSLNLKLTNSVKSPRFEVSDFKVRDASARAPGFWGQGAVHPLPNVDADGVYENGILTINKFEARLVSDDPQKEDMLLHTIGTGTIEPNGQINADLELLHGHLEDLSLWISSLRNDDGSSALKGNVNQVVLHVEGTTSAPHVTRSILADELSYKDYTLDRLRVSRFDIQNGGILIRPGNFTVVKGEYQSSTGWGVLPWSWGTNDAPLGFIRDSPIEVHLPLQDQDFGALTGLFLPAVTKASAKAFRGSLSITGSLEKPLLNGVITIEDGKMVLNDATAPFRAGIANLSGSLRFEKGNVLSIDATDPIRGRLVSASTIDAPQTGNRPQSTFIRLPGGEPYLGGDFQLNGNIVLDMDALSFIALRRNLSSHHYDLKLMVHDASFATDSISGLRHMNLSMLWKTGNIDPALQQNVRWIMTADGVDKKGAEKGNVLGFGDFMLDPRFGVNLNQLLAVRSEAFTQAVDFAALGLVNSQKLFTSLPLQSIEGKMGNIQLNDFGIAVKDVGNGVLNGTLNLSNNNSGSLLVAGDINISQSELTALPADNSVSSEAFWPNAPLLDIHFDLGEDVQFSASNLRATLGGYLNVSGTPYDPLLLGTFDILRGQAIFPGARARITDGRLSLTARRDLLTGQLQPRVNLDATAEGRSGRYLITLHLHGPLDMGQKTSQTLLVDISSDPPLSRDEAFSQLLGTSVFNNPGVGDRDQAYAQAVLGLLSGTLFSGLENSIAKTLGLSSITLDYQLNAPLGIEVGKAIGDKLYLSYRRSIGKDATNVTPYEFQLQYRVKGGLELGLKMNEQNQRTFTLEKRWRF